MVSSLLQISMAHPDWGATASLKWIHCPQAPCLGFVAPSPQAERATSTRYAAAAAAAGAGTQAPEVLGGCLQNHKFCCILCRQLHTATVEEFRALHKRASKCCCCMHRDAAAGGDAARTSAFYAGSDEHLHGPLRRYLPGCSRQAGGPRSQWRFVRPADPDVACLNFSKCWGHMLTPLVVARVLRGLRLAPLLRRRPCRHRRGSTPCSSLLLLLLLTPAVRLHGCASSIGHLPRGLLSSRLVRAPGVNLFHWRWRWRRRLSLLLPANIQMPLCLQKAVYI